MRKRTYLSLGVEELGGWVISLDLRGSVSPRECPWHMQHFDEASADDSLSLRWEEPIGRLPSVMGLCVLTTSLAGHSVRRP